MISGFDYRALRESLGLKRPDIAERAGLSVAVIARIETTGKIKPVEHEAMRKAFPAKQAADGEPAQPRIIDDAPSTLHHRTREWNGLVTGDKCKVSGTTRSRWEFVAYCTSPNGAEYVEVKGGKAGHVLLRAFAPERVTTIPVKKKRRRKTEDE